MSQKVLKKGEFLYKDGDKVQSVYLIQSGSISQCLVRDKKTIDMFKLGSSQILGEQVLIGQNTFNTAAMATTETKLLEIPLDTLKQAYDTAPQMLKILLKSMAERLKQAVTEVRANRMEKDSSPCPDEKIPQVFAAIYFTARHKGDKSNPARTIVDWNMMRQYSQRVLGESPKRIEQAINILVKMQLALYEMGKSPDNPDGPDEIQKVHFLDLDLVEAFFEFYQYYYFKGGKTELLRVDENAYNILGGIIKLCADLEPDRFGIVSLDFAKLADYCKEELGINLNNDHFTRLETKGVLCKRKPTTAGVLLQFELKEYRSIYFSWRVIKEIDRWNERGFVDINEKEEKPKKKTGGPTCPDCQTEVAAQAKFCHNCGAKLTPAAA